MIELTIKLASFCLDLFKEVIKDGIINLEVNPRSETTSMNSKNVNP